MVNIKLHDQVSSSLHVIGKEAFYSKNIFDGCEPLMIYNVVKAMWLGQSQDCFSNLGQLHVIIADFGIIYFQNHVSTP